MKKTLTSILTRTLFIVLFVTLQAATLVAMFLAFRKYFAYFYLFCILLTVFATLYIVSSNTNPAYKIAWIIPIMLFPIFGGPFYLMFGKVRPSRKERKLTAEIEERYHSVVNHRKDEFNSLREESKDAAIQASYIEKAASAPVYTNTETTYFSLGEEMFERMLQELEKAEKFIFMEYFILQEGKMWNAILEVLERKAATGVDVRVMYDDMGCLFTLPANYAQILEEKGIHCCVFNRFTNIFSSRFNNRDHRKICVIDGNIGFTGGINLADEYINAIEKHGHWKDTAIMLRGDAVWSLTVMFLALWDYVRHEQDEFDEYAPTISVDAPGYVQPFNDSPLDNDAVGENVYMNMISRAKEYVYITTPYLIIDNEMITALSTAAKSGIDVRIITPHIADKKFVHSLTRSHYEVLLTAGVRIYEYTPGFIHAKSFVADDEYAIVGTINLDFRSLYLHYECAAWMYKTPAVVEIKQDFLTTLARSQEVPVDDCQKVKGIRRLGLSILRIFAPLM
ncbi:cardiolipin synthase [Pygmaiobacter massiliensis]|uniref:cardiolipin synthase n=1 Tax=Pygmaiobacter massiliensis TaxID=1917873 RepID=UPI0028A28781|nr:cardiolipin synthase [Pygmaiobacter massiliensis]